MDNINEHKKKAMTDKELTELAQRIVVRMAHVKTMEEWFGHVKKTSLPIGQEVDDLQISDEYRAYGELAKCLTLLNLLQEDEEYEMCVVVKDKIDELDKILKRYDEMYEEDDEHSQE